MSKAEPAAPEPQELTRERLYALRKHHNWSLQEAGAIVGVPAARWHLWEGGLARPREPMVSVLWELIRVAEKEAAEAAPVGPSPLP